LTRTRLVAYYVAKVSVCEHGNTAAAAEEEQQDDDTSDSSTQKAPLREITAERSREIKLTLSDEHRNFLQTIVDKYEGFSIVDTVIRQIVTTVLITGTDDEGGNYMEDAEIPGLLNVLEIVDSDVLFSTNEEITIEVDVTELEAIERLEKQFPVIENSAQVVKLLICWCMPKAHLKSPDKADPMTDSSEAFELEALHAEMFEAFTIGYSLEEKSAAL